MNFLVTQKSDKPKQENVEDPKNLCGANSSSYHDNDDIFTEGLDSFSPRNMLYINVWVTCKLNWMEAIEKLLGNWKILLNLLNF